MARWKRFEIIEVESLLAARGGGRSAGAASGQEARALEQVRGGANHFPSVARFADLIFFQKGRSSQKA